MPKIDWKWAVACILGLAGIILWLLSKESGVSTSPVRWTLCLLLPALISLQGMRRNSLDFSGGMLAILVGFLLTAASACFCSSLLAFFITSSRLTKWRGKEKRKYEADYKEGGQRNWVQVLCNGGVASAAALLYLGSAGMGETPVSLWLRPDPAAPRQLHLPTLYAIASLAALSCSCGDTWASEIGSVAGGTPRLITTWKQVPRGTNGGVSVVGVLCSLVGGLVVGAAYFLPLPLFLDSNESVTLWSQLAVAVAVGGTAGFVGSLVDSVLGATVQFSGYSEKLGRVVNAPGPGVQHVSGLDVLGNHAVNFVSSLITAVVVPLGYYAFS